MKLCEDFVLYDIDGEKILVCLDSAKFAGVIKLNCTSAFIVENLKDEKSKDELLDVMTAHFSGADGISMEKDLDELLEKLAPFGVIRN